MCGIAGSLSKKGVRSRTAVLDALKHRGPEACGVWADPVCGHQVELFHNRLRIIDVSEGGAQPMTIGRKTLVFNGEIYNFLELRRILEEDGFRFGSNSDTEVVLVAYEQWGIECLHRFHGMFAFALWDGEKKELLLARDRLGKKPLFYFEDGCSFVFGSEIKVILAMLERTPEIDHEALHDYLTYLYVSYPRTIFRGVRQLGPGCWMRVKGNGTVFQTETGRYWDPIRATGTQRYAPSEMSVDDLRSHTQDLVAASVRCRLVSDVPLGVLLSGGMDSSSITAMMARSSTEPVRSFSIGFPGNSAYDEIPYARRVAEQFGCEHEVLQADPDCSKHLAKIIWHFDQPFGNPTAVLTYILSALTKKSVTVALAGDGGDELFGGYPRYIGAYLSTLPRALPGFLSNGLFPWLGRTMSDDSSGKHQFRRLREFLEDAGMPLIEMYLRWIGYFSPEEKERLYTPDLKKKVGDHDPGNFLRGLYEQSEGLEPLNRLAYVDTKSFLCCNVLEYADRMSMAHALELRAPFTDHRLVEFSLRLPFQYKFRYAESKWLLRQAMKPFLPAEVLNKQKLGFNPPVGSWLKGELAGLPATLLSRKCVKERGLFEPDEIDRILKQHKSGKRDYSLHIWALMVLEIWFRMYVDGKSVESVQEEIDEACLAVHHS